MESPAEAADLLDDPTIVELVAQAMSGVLAIAVLLAFFGAILRLGSRIHPRGEGRDEAWRRGAELPLFPFGRQPTEPVDAERVRAGRPF